MQEVVADLQRIESTDIYTLPDPLPFPSTGEVSVVLRIHASEVLRTRGMVAIANDVPQPADFARAYDAAMKHLADRAGVAPLVLPGIEVSLDSRVTGLGLPPGIAACQLQITIPFITVRSDALATLATKAAAEGCRIGSVRVEVRDDTVQGAIASTVTPALTPADISNLILWFDGIAKFIDITKAHLPDLDTGRTLMMQRLSRHTMALKKRLQELRTPDSA